MLYRDSDYHRSSQDTFRNGVDIQEAELAFFADVDPYSRLNMLFSVHPSYGLESGEVVQSWEFEPEEVYAESNIVPSTTLKLGKFKAAFGKHNVLHAHAFPFVDSPLINEQMLGEEGLADVGVSAAYLLPLPWFSEFTGQFLKGEGENEEFNSQTTGDGVGVFRFSNLADMSDDLTVEIGASYAGGRNSQDGATRLFGGDLTFKWRPSQGGSSRSALLGVEFMGRDMAFHKSDPKGTEFSRGWSVWARYQFATRWSTALRFEDLHVKSTDVIPPEVTNRGTIDLTFAATEFSNFKFEFSQLHGPPQSNGDRTEQRVNLQAGFTIGAHPAHAY
jgi:hypothetical protein